MPYHLTHAILLDLDPIRVEAAELRLDGGRIVERGPALARRPDETVVDCEGCIALPGLVNGHTHLYSALATGMPPPPRVPRNFREILELVWWRLDQALDARSNETSAFIGALDALRCGTTTLIDHHASPNAIDGSLDAIERGIAAVGLRGVLCYEVTDRHGRGGREAGLAENRRYLAKCAAGGRPSPRPSPWKGEGANRPSAGKSGCTSAGEPDNFSADKSHSRQFSGLVGAHASFTLEDDALDALAALARETQTGVHIHVAEDPCDEADCRARTGGPLMERLARHGLLAASSVFGHGTHLSPDAVARVNAAGLTMAHNSRSNMNNAVGYAPVAAFAGPVMLGTDGIGADLFAEARSAWLISRHARSGVSPLRILEMLAASARRASQSLGVTLGKLAVGAAADVVVTDYRPFTPIQDDNVIGHFLFGLHAGYVRHVFADGVWALRDRRVMTIDEMEIRSKAIQVSRDLWDRMS